MRSLPRARTAELVIHEFEGETLVYDLRQHRLHELSPAAYLIWRHCDGETGIAEVTTMMQQDLGLPAEPALVRTALRDLGRADLLQERPAWTLSRSRGTRRALMAQLGRAGAVAASLWFVRSLIAPSAAQANSCVQEHDTCTPGVSVCCDDRQCEFDEGRFQCK